MENNKSHGKIIILTFVVALVVVMGLVFGLNWNAWFGGNAGLGQAQTGERSLVIDDEEQVYNAKYIIDGIDVKLSGGEYVSEKDNEVMFLVVNGGSITIDGSTLTKSGEDVYAETVENGFYGKNSMIVLVGENSRADIKNANFDIKSNGTSAVFAVEGANATVEDSNVTASGSYSAGFTAGDSSEITVNNTEINLGDDSEEASMMSDRAYVAFLPSAKITVNGGVVNNYTYYLAASIYDEGDITVNNAKFYSSNSPFAVLSGNGKLTLNGGEYTSNYPFGRRFDLKSVYGGHYDNSWVISSAVIFAGGEPTFVSNDATLTQKSYSTLSDLGEARLMKAFFTASGAKPTVKLNNTTVNIGTNTVKLAGAVSGSTLTIDASGLNAEASREYEADETSSVTGL